MRKANLMTFLGTSLAGLLITIVASAAIAVSGTPAVVGVATGPGGLKIEAKTSKLAAAETDAKVTIDVDLASLETGIALRDKHMREKYLEVAKYPKATLVLPRDALKLPPAYGTSSGKATGDFSLHGVTKPTEFQYTLVKTANGYKVLGQFKILLASHKIEIPSYLGVTVGPEVHMTVSFDLVEK